ncbi:MAG: S8 family serine peptidase, partial [Sedimentisphaerales bacterium]|nr:S8 family serine peptidase [Sedimentisphaerales bacterium]
MYRVLNRNILCSILLYQVIWTASFAPAQEVIQPECLEPIGVREVTAFQPELTGRSVNVALVELSQPGDDPDNDILDYHFLPNIDHQALENINLRNIYSYQNPQRQALSSDHASMIAGILFGDTGEDLVEMERPGRFRYKGIIPQASVDLFETNWFLYKKVLSSEHEPFDNDVISISWGTDADDAVTMWWQRGLDAMVVRDNVLIVAASGNGSDEFHSISKPSWGHNIISVGAARSLGRYPEFLTYLGPPTENGSNSGPTEDGRCKPELIAPGLCLGPVAYSYKTFVCDMSAESFSSYAAPQVAGVAGLLIDAARQNDLIPADDPRVIKALLLNGANKLIGWHKGFSGLDDDYAAPLDYRQGAGLVDAWNSYQQLIAGRYDPNQMDSNTGWDWNMVSLDPNYPDHQKVYYLPRPVAKEGVITATLCWYQYYQQEGIAYQPLPHNILVLELWSVDDEGRLLDRLDYSESTLDTLQHIYYQNVTELQVALVVSVLPRSQGLDGYEAFGLAFTDNQSNWLGDQLAGDLNADGIVAVQDMMQLINAWKSQKDGDMLTDYYFKEDINCDGLIDALDFEIMATQWQKQSAWY